MISSQEPQKRLYSYPTHQPRCGVASLATFKKARAEVSGFFFFSFLGKMRTAIGMPWEGRENEVSGRVPGVDSLLRLGRKG